MQSLRRVGVACIVVGVMVPICTFFGPILWYRFRRLLHIPGPSFISFGNESVQRVVVSLMASGVLVLFGILYIRDASRQTKTEQSKD